KGVLGQLLRDGAAALQVDLVSEHVADVHHYGSNEGPEIDAVMLVETRIFDGDDGIQQVLWHLAQRHRDAVFAVQRGDAPSLNVVDVAGQLLLEDDLVERRRAAQVSRQHARGGAENDGDDEYGDDQGKAAERPARQRGVPPGDTLLGLLIITCCICGSSRGRRPCRRRTGRATIYVLPRQTARNIRWSLCP